MKLRTILASVAAVLVAGTISFAANISLFSGAASGCSEGSQMLSCLNQTIQAVNNGVSGVIFNNQASASTTATTAETTLQTFSLPANYVSATGQEVEIECWGQMGATSNNKTVKIYFGSTSVSTGVTQSNAKYFRLNMKVDRSGAATQNIGTLANLDTTSSTNYTYGGTDSFASAQTIKCTGTNGTSTAGDISVGGMSVKIHR